MTTALAKAPVPEGGLLKVEEARQLLAQATQIAEVKKFRDQAQAIAAYQRQQKAALESQQDAGTIKLLAEARLGELLQEKAERGERQGRGDAGRAKANAPKAGDQPLAAPPPTLADLGISKYHASVFQRVSEVPEEKRAKYVEVAREKGSEVTTAGLLTFAAQRNPHAASNVNNAAPDKNDKFTERAWVQALKDEFGLTRDYAGHPLAPATEIFGREHVYTVEDDCFVQEWTEAGLLNPPWDELPRFVVFGWLKVATGECPRLVLPLPGTRWEQDWARYFVHPFRPDEGGSGARIRFPHGRKGYGTVLDPEGERPDNNVGLPSAELILEGPFVRSSHPRWVSEPSIDEVLADQRFGEDKGLAHLWRQALQLARGEVAPTRRALADQRESEELPFAEEALAAYRKGENLCPGCGRTDKEVRSGREGWLHQGGKLSICGRCSKTDKAAPTVTTEDQEAWKAAQDARDRKARGKKKKGGRR